MKKRNHLVKVQKLMDIKSDESYWEWIDKKAHRDGGQGAGNRLHPIAGGDDEIREPKRANPDVLPESAGFYYTDEEAAAETRRRAALIEEIMAECLTPLELRVILALQHGVSLAAVATRFNKSKSAIQQTLIRAREKIQRLYEARNKD